MSESDVRKGHLKGRAWRWVFLSVAVMTLAQVLWWTSVFLTDVEERAELRVRNAELWSAADPKHPVSSREEIQKEAFHRRLMFLSESTFFMIVLCAGMYFLYRALKSEERAREAERTLIEIVSHESKTPLTALKLRLEATREKRLGDESLSKELGLALHEVRRLGSLVSKALTLSRVDREAFSFEPIILNDVVEDVVHRLDPLFKAKQVDLDLSLNEEAVVSGDSQGLQNSLEGLLENAILYNDRPDRKVRLSISTTASKVLLHVKDNGPGVEPSEEKKIFERFYRGTKSRGKSGSGLGLYITKTIVEAHQGVLRLVKSKEPGCHFEIELPRVTA